MIGLGSAKPTLQDKIEARIAQRRKAAAMAAAQAKLKAGDTYQEYVNVRQDEHTAASKYYAGIEQQFEKRKRPAIRAKVSEHQAAVDGLARAVARANSLDREAALLAVEMRELSETVRMLTAAAEGESDAQVAQWLAVYGESDADKLATLNDSLEAKRTEAANLRAQLPAMERTAADIVASLAV